jgi:hypothetical protein
MLEKLPKEAREWAESLPWKERRYVLSLCHLLCAASPDIQASFLDEYTAEGMITKILTDYDAQKTVETYLAKFRIGTSLTGETLRRYIRQFYIHSAQDMRRQPNKYLESALKLVASHQEKNNILNYILGFELLKMIFRMSWLEQERFYRLQINQDDFYHRYIKPIQYAHRVNKIINPKDENVFFAKRDYYIQKPDINDKKLIELIMLTFSTEQVCDLGFGLSHSLKHIIFDYDHIYHDQEEKPQAFSV